MSGPLFAYFFGSLILFTLQIGFGRYLAALFYHRQTLHLATTMLRNDSTLLYCQSQRPFSHSNPVSEIPAVFSSDVVDFNIPFGQLMYGTVYHNGWLSILILCILYTKLLADEGGGYAAPLIVYISQIIFNGLIIFVDIWFAPRNRKYQSSLSELSHLHRRADALAEQIALSDQTVQHMEANQPKRIALHGQHAAQYHSFILHFCWSCKPQLCVWQHCLVRIPFVSALTFICHRYSSRN